MTDHPNAAIVREGFEAFLQGDMDKIRSLMGDDIEWIVLGDNPTSGVYRGKSEVISYFGHMIMETEGTLQLEVEDFIGNDERVVIVTRVRAQRRGKSMGLREIQIFEMSSLGKAMRCVGPFADDTKQIDEFWS